MRTRLQMEAQIRETLTQFRRGNRGHEDLFVELKRILPADPQRAARRIAGLCNSAHGVEALWIIGVDEKTGGTCFEEQHDIDVGHWWPQVQRHFDDVIPDMRHVIVHIEDDQPVVGLFFATDQAPYVIKVPAGMTQKEIPWRDATNTRSAARREIMQVLAPAVSIPAIDHIETTITAERSVVPTAGPATFRLHLTTQLFVDATSQVAFPLHRQKLSIRLGDCAYDMAPALHQRMRGRGSDDFIKVSDDAVAVLLPSMLFISGWMIVTGPFVALEDLVGRSAKANFSVELGLSGIDKAWIFHGVAERGTSSDAVLDRPPISHPWRPEPWKSVSPSSNSA